MVAEAMRLVEMLPRSDGGDNDMWNPTEYLNFSNERSRPFFDLLAQIPRFEAATIADLGCGPGTLTKTLADRWPDAQVIGVDSSPEMLEKARPLTVSGHLEFVEADIAHWSPLPSLI